VLTRNLPNAEELTRVWVDPAGRICVISGANRLHVLFPDGRIPKRIAEMMPLEQLNANEGD
jgi:hypothetical protein